MDYKPQVSVIILIKFDKMIATSKASNAAISQRYISRSNQVIQMAEIAKRFIVYIEPCRNICINYIIQFWKVNILFCNPDSKHTAADVYPNQIRAYLIRNCHCRTDDASGACMAVRHDSDFRIIDVILVQQFYYLADGLIVNIVSENLCGVVFSV